MGVTGVVLSGGRSSRMRSNKAFVEVQGQTIIETVLDKLSGLLDDVILVTNDPASYIKYEPRIRIVTDIIPNKGPLSGIHSGLYHARHQYIVAVACDMPFLNIGLIRYMIGLEEGRDAVVPKIGEYFQPLCAVYGKQCQDLIEKSLLADELQINRLYRKLNICYVDEKDIRKFGDPEMMFFNVNNQEDLEKAQQMAREAI